jgi:GntR family transcriptional regulator/MocR family aminotransferase
VATKLKISQISVFNAYEQLLSKGYLETFVGSGTSVGRTMPDEALVLHVAYVTPSHQYPLGMTMTAGRRMSMLKWARTTDSWIIEDDYDREFLPAFNDSAQSCAKQRQKRNSSR